MKRRAQIPMKSIYTADPGEVAGDFASDNST
jgi:hypothetical protein